MTCILIADDHAIVSDGAPRIFEGAPGFEVAGEAVARLVQTAEEKSKSS